MKKIKLLAMPLALIPIVPVLTLGSCKKDTTTTYSITFDKEIDHLTWVKTQSSVAAGSSVTMTYTVDDDYEIDTDNTTITCGTTPIKTYCNFAYGTIYIPSNIINGNIVISLAVKQSVIYNVTYNTPSKLTWNTTQNTVKQGKTLTMTYTLDSGYRIDTANSTITSNGSSIKDYIDYRYGTISIPTKYIKGDVVITLATKEATKYDVTYTDVDHITWTDNPEKATESVNFTAGYTIDDGWYLDEENCLITCNGVDITEHVSFGNGTIIISGAYVTNVITITLAVTDTAPGAGTYTDLVGGTIKSKTDESGLTTHTLACTETNGTMSITLYGTWTNSSIQIKSSGTYNITLDNLTLSNLASSDTAAAAPINITKKAAGAVVNFILPTNSESSINDLRSYGSSSSPTEYEEDYVVRHNSSDGSGSLNFTGAGMLNINNINSNKGVYVPAIKTKTDVTISNGAIINAFAYDTCIQVGGKLTIDNGNLLADSYYDDGIKTKAADAADDLAFTTNKNNNRDIIINGKSQITVYSARNGISATHNFITQSDSNGSPTINVYTNKQASLAKSGCVGTVSLDEQNMFIQVPSSVVSKYPLASYYYTVDFYADNTGSESTSSEYLTLKKIVDSKGYFFKTDRPLSSDAKYFKLNIYKKDQYGIVDSEGESTSVATATSGYILTASTPTATNTKDCIAISSISSSTISMGATSLNNNYKNLVKGDETSIDTTIGSKGIKAKNDITINAGTINIKLVDTCISASYGDIFCTSTTAGNITFGTGNITFNGGSLTGYSSTDSSGTKSSDGVKAYGEMNVNGGEINITNSVEALEAPVLNISGGIIKLYAQDDGLNASTAGTHTTSQLNVSISGGILDVQTGSGDCDAIDSNNTVTITGGLLISRVPGSGSSMTLDWESGNVSVTGTATVVLLGKTEADGMQANGGPGGGDQKSISTTGTDYTSSISTSTACASGNHIIKYAGGASTYTYNNKTTMSSSKVRVWSCNGSVTIS